MEPIVNNPPKAARWIVRRLSKYEHRFSLEGDLAETHRALTAKSNRSRAGFWYWSQAIRALVMYLGLYIRSSLDMVTNYFKIALRGIGRNKGYSLINITGLALGIACCLLIAAFVVHEVSYDRFHEHAKDIYRLDTRIRISGRLEHTATVPPLMGPTMVQDFPEVLDAVRFRYFGGDTFQYEEHRFHEPGLLYTDNSIFNVFSFDFVRGDLDAALAAPRSIVLTEEMARKYFGDEDPMGKILKRDNWEAFTVTGIVKKPAVNSHFSFDMLASMETLVQNSPERLNRWAGWNFQTYILLQDGVDPKDLEEKLIEFNRKYVGDILDMLGAEVHNSLRPLTRIHLYSHINGELSINGDITTVYAFSAIAVFILLIACINFMNLSTARAARRMKEIGIRKVLGADRAQLSRQFLGESIVFSTIATLVSVLLTVGALPLLRALSRREIAFDEMRLPMIIGVLIGVALLVGIIAGLYPSIILSRYRPSRIIKRGFDRSGGQSLFRNVLVVVQFSISIFLIVGTVIVYRQMVYMKNRNLGFDRDHIVSIPIRDGNTRDRVKILKEEIASIKSVVSVSSSSSIPGRDTYWNDAYYPEDWQSDRPFFMKMMEVDEDFFETYGIPVVRGRMFSEEMVSDAERALVINETTVEQLEWAEPLGKQIGEISDITDLSRRQFRTVVGIIGDYHFLSMHTPIEPLYITFGIRYANFLSIRLQVGNVSDGLRDVERVWKRILPDREFEYFFIDEFFDRQYRSDERLGRIFRTFTGLAVFIGCLGLYGLASFSVERRTKEVGIRKVLGSSVYDIVLLLSRKYIRIILAANCIAWPLAFLIMRRWLQHFAYQTRIGIEIFAFSGAGALCIALLTIGYRTIRAAKSNPVEALRYE